MPLQNIREMWNSGKNKDAITKLVKKCDRQSIWGYICKIYEEMWKWDILRVYLQKSWKMWKCESSRVYLQKS